METENIERIIDKEEDNQPKVEEEEKSINEEEEESEINNDENPQKQDSNLIESRSQENEPEVEEANINEQNPDKETQKEKEKENIDPYSTTTYILKYKRTKEEMKELAVETNLPKRTCFDIIYIIYIILFYIIIKKSKATLNSEIEGGIFYYLNIKKTKENKFLEKLNRNNKSIFKVQNSQALFQKSNLLLNMKAKLIQYNIKKRNISEMI